MMYDNDEEVELIDITEYMDQDSTYDSYNHDSYNNDTSSERRGSLDKSPLGRKYTKTEKDSRKDMTPKRNGAGVWAGRVCATLGVTVLALVVFLYGVMAILCLGPSKTARTQFVLSVQETSAIGGLARLFCSEQEIQEIKNKNSIKDTNETSDASLVVIDSVDNEEVPDIQVIDVQGATYKGKLMIIKDPSRLFVGTIGEFVEGNGTSVARMAKKYDAIAGINGGEFVDGETTWTGMPVGLVMVDGKVLNGNSSTTYHVTGITYDNKLVVGNMTEDEAKNNNIRDCVSISSSIGPFLVVNGNPQDVSGIGGGINPRTAIGQTADGSILLLAIDGRMANSLGASFSDLQDIMLQYGAVNASTMDGGTSTQMYYDGEIINTPYLPSGPRSCPTSFLIK